MALIQTPIAFTDLAANYAFHLRRLRRASAPVAIPIYHQSRACWLGVMLNDMGLHVHAPHIWTDKKISKKNLGLYLKRLGIENDLQDHARSLNGINTLTVQWLEHVQDRLYGTETYTVDLRNPYKYWCGALIIVSRGPSAATLQSFGNTLNVISTSGLDFQLRFGADPRPPAIIRRYGPVPPWP